MPTSGERQAGLRNHNVQWQVQRLLSLPACVRACTPAACLPARPSPPSLLPPPPLPSATPPGPTCRCCSTAPLPTSVGTQICSGCGRAASARRCPTPTPPGLISRRERALVVELWGCGTPCRCVLAHPSAAGPLPVPLPRAAHPPPPNFLAPGHICCLARHHHQAGSQSRLCRCACACRDACVACWARNPSQPQPAAYTAQP